MNVKTTNKPDDTFGKALSEWNKLTRQEQDCLCKKNPDELSKEQTALIELLLEGTNSEKLPKFSSCKPLVKEKQLEKLTEQVRKWMFDKMVISILQNSHSKSTKKEEKRMLVIEKLWTEKPDFFKEEILLKKWEALNQDEIIWVSGLLQIVYRISEKNWQNCDSSKKTKLLSQLNNFLRQDRQAFIVGRNLRKIRTSLAKWNQIEVARMIGSNQSILSKIENGQNVDIHHFLDLLAMYSQYVSIEGLFSENFSIVKKTDSMSTNTELAERTFEHCQKMINEGMFLMHEFLSKNARSLMEITQSSCGNLLTQNEENLRWLLTTNFSPEEVSFIRRTFNDATQKAIGTL